MPSASKGIQSPIESITPPLWDQTVTPKTENNPAYSSIGGVRCKRLFQYWKWKRAL